MPETPIYKFEIQLLNADGVTPDSIVRAPRVYKPQDLQSACQNVNIISSGAEPVPTVVAMVEFVILDFFVLAHRTGLYNRQKNLWESLSKVATVSVFPLKRGLFKRTQLPLYDMHFQDYRGRAFILAHLIDPSYQEAKDVNERHMKRFLKRAEKQNGLTGLFLCYPGPFPSNVQDKASKLTGSNDPVGRYESLLPEPWSAPLNLLEISSADATADEARPKIRLVHPDLTATKRIRAAAVHEDV